MFGAKNGAGAQSGLTMMLKAMGIEFDPAAFAEVGRAVVDVRDSLKRIEAKLDAEREREVSILHTYGHHLGSCKGFPASSEEALARDCTCGFQKLLEGVKDGG